MPTAFSPNADGRNDIFRPIPAGISSTKKFSVYNRYGTMVLKPANGLKDGMDGTKDKCNLLVLIYGF
ncbi:MAG: gliding motility-associated C-terminal domain-containing protein [Chitinophagaceae bacterium]|nr:gliding motility-associated C-terminal domain-containing protein [Chitinophagaceae bacterium]